MYDTLKQELHNGVDEYMNMQTGEKLDLEKVLILPEKFMLKVKPELWVEWDFEKNDKLGFDIWKMTKSDNTIVWWTCDKCRSNYDNKVANRVNNNCPCCRGLRITDKNSLATLRPDVASQWHPTKNGELTPDDVPCGSRKKVWWQCKLGHEWEVTVNARTGGDNRKGSNCPYCSNYKLLVGFNDIWTTNPRLASLLLNHDDGYKYMQGTKTVKLSWKCDNCGEIIHNKSPMQVKNEGLKCICSRNKIKYPERYVIYLLNELGINYVREKVFKWSDNKRYDFYIEHKNNKLNNNMIVNENIIIETHGMQHYEESNITIRTLEEEQVNDEYKYTLAVNNGINNENYITIDCRYSKFDYIKNNIHKSRMSEVFDLRNVNWSSIKYKLNKTLIENVCEEWNNGNHSSKKIANIYIISSVKSCIKLLKKGTERGMCDYNEIEDEYFNHKVILQLDGEFNIIDKYISIEDIKSRTGIDIKGINRKRLIEGSYYCYEKDYINYKNLIHESLKTKKIAQLDLKGKLIKVWSSIDEIVSENSDYNYTTIKSTITFYQNTYKGFIWIYNNFYNTEEGKEYINNLIGKKLIGSKKKALLQINSVTGEVINTYESVPDAYKSTGIKVGSINKCLSKTRLSTGGFIWMRQSYYESEEGQEYLSEILHRIKAFKDKK